MDKTQRDRQLLENAVATDEKQSLVLVCDLTNDEQRERGLQLANALAEGRKLTEEKKVIANDFKAREQEVAIKVQQLEQVVSTRREYREVDCTEHRDYKAGKVYVVRDDLGSIADARNMTPTERQSLIPGMEVLPGVTLQSVKDADAKSVVGHAFQIRDDNTDLCKSCGFPKRDQAHSMKNRGVALDENSRPKTKTATAHA